MILALCATGETMRSEVVGFTYGVDEQRLPMNVSPDRAVVLIGIVSRLEFAFNELGIFIEGKHGKQPKIDWSRFYEAVEAQAIADQSVNTAPQDRDLLLGTYIGGPPQRMRVSDADGSRKVRFFDEPLREPTELAQILEAAIRIRNNLVHGGKERQEQQRMEHHDQDLVNAAIRVLQNASRVIPEVNALCWE